MSPSNNPPTAGAAEIWSVMARGQLRRLARPDWAVERSFAAENPPRSGEQTSRQTQCGDQHISRAVSLSCRIGRRTAPWARASDARGVKVAVALA